MSLKLKNILVTTAHRGVFWCQVEEDKDLTASNLTKLKNCVMAIYWGTTKGIQELASTGPTEKTRMSAMTDIEILHGVTAVFSVSDEAANKIWK